MIFISHIIIIIAIDIRIIIKMTIEIMTLVLKLSDRLFQLLLQL